MIDQCSRSLAVQRAKRGDIRGFDAYLFADVKPKSFRNAINRVEASAAHANESNVKRYGESMQSGSTCGDDGAFFGAVSEKGGEFEIIKPCRDFA
jgi:hypothetical protein